MIPPGIFIAFEGCDAAGKKTSSTNLVEYLNNIGISAVRYAFPRYETPLGSLILEHLKSRVSMIVKPTLETHHQDPLAFQCLMLADKYDVVNEIKVALQAGKIVVADRWEDSAICYGGSDGLDMTWLVKTHSSLLHPDLSFLLDITPEEARKRRPEVRDRYEAKMEKQADVRKRYHRLWTDGNNDGTKRILIDGTRSPEDILDDVICHIMQFMMLDRKNLGQKETPCED